MDRLTGLANPAPDPIDTLYRRIVNPGKANGHNLTVDDLEIIEWVALRHLLGKLLVEIIADDDGNAYIVPTASITDLVRSGYLKMNPADAWAMWGQGTPNIERLLEGRECVYLGSDLGAPFPGDTE